MLCKCHTFLNPNLYMFLVLLVVLVNYHLIQICTTWTFRICSHLRILKAFPLFWNIYRILKRIWPRWNLNLYLIGSINLLRFHGNLTLLLLFTLQFIRYLPVYGKAHCFHQLDIFCCSSQYILIIHNGLLKIIV